MQLGQGGEDQWVGGARWGGAGHFAEPQRLPFPCLTDRGRALRKVGLS
jgi:hypothetical protein